jgi:hypothetical protein
MVQLLQPSRAADKHGRRRLLWIGLGVLVLAGAGLWLGQEPLARRYHFWKQDRALRQAKEFIAARDALSAQLALDVALKAAPGNADTIRVAADILEQVGAAQAMRLRRAVARLRPDSAEDAALLVFSCLRFRDFNAARDALAEASPGISQEPPMLRAALAFALATGDTPVADILLRTLRERLPEDIEIRQTQALLYLRHPDTEKRDEARRTLTEIAREHPERALRIERELAGVALESQDYAEARRRLDHVLASPGATFDDRLHKANIELLIDRRPFAEVFAELTPEAGKDVENAARMMRWLLVQNRGDEAERWLVSLPSAIREERAVRALEADMFAQRRQWDRLASLLEAGVWGAVPPESVRLAMSARLVDAQNNRSLRGEIWEAATHACGGSLSGLTVLHRLATLWGWDKEADDTLWTVVRAYPDQTWAHQALFNTYKERRDTASMRDVLGALRQSNGAVPRYRHDWALLTLLREPSPLWNSAKDVMKELHEQHPTNIVYATGYAFALAQAERPEEALAVLKEFPAAELEIAPRLPYLAYVNGMARNAEEVTRLVGLARGSGMRYLPEEERLIERSAEAPFRPLLKSRSRRGAGNAGDAEEAGASASSTDTPSSS